MPLRLKQVLFIEPPVRFCLIGYLAPLQSDRTNQFENNSHPRTTLSKHRISSTTSSSLRPKG